MPHNRDLRDALARMHRVASHLHPIRYEEADTAARPGAYCIIEFQLPFGTSEHASDKVSSRSFLWRQEGVGEDIRSCLAGHLFDAPSSAAIDGWHGQPSRGRRLVE